MVDSYKGYDKYAKANGLNTYEYLHNTFKELPNTKNSKENEALLPRNFELG